MSDDDLDRLLTGPRILTLDIETSPNVADVWGLWDQNVSLNQLRESSRVLCFAAKWYERKQVLFHSEHHDSREHTVNQAWSLLDQADVLVTYNGPSFDVKHLQREFILAGKPPPSPFKNVDLLKVARSQFKFPSNKLDYVAGALGLGGKVKHEGHGLWSACLAGDEAAWARMRRYNVGDVRLTERLFERLGPWIKAFPHHGLYNGEERCCFRCGATNLLAAGWVRTAVTAYAAYRCGDCGALSRNNNRKAAVTMRAVS